MKKQKKQKKIDLFDLVETDKVEEVSEEKEEALKVFYFTNDLLKHKEYVLNDETEKYLKVFSLNRCLSADMACVLHVNEMNIRSQASKNMVYDYYFYSLKKSNAYLPFIKKEKSEDVDNLMKFYNYNRTRAKEVLKLHSRDQLDEIAKKFCVGGLSK